MTHRTYDVALRRQRREPFTFTLRTTDNEDSPMWTIDLDRIPGSLCVGVSTATEFWTIYRAGLGEAQYEVFRAWIDDPSRSVEGVLLNAIAQDIITERTGGLPTQQPASS